MQQIEENRPDPEVSESAETIALEGAEKHSESPLTNQDTVPPLDSGNLAFSDSETIPPRQANLSNAETIAPSSARESNDPRVESLVGKWESGWREGDTLPVKQLCAECPELIPEVQKRIDAIVDLAPFMESMQSGDQTPPVRPSAETSKTPSIPGYQITGKLGEGGMGVVYKARQQNLGRMVAIKMIVAGAHARSQDRVRFLAEAEAVAQLQHPNIVQLHEFGQYDNLPFFTLEFVDGGSLNDLLKKDGPMRPQEAAACIEQLANAMQQAHTAGIVHRDLKPQNVLLTKSGTPKITDFGLVKRTEMGTGLTESGSIMGTPSYMSPEQAGGDNKQVGPPTDIYALGAVLYECLTGRPPFQAPSAMDTVLQVINEEPVPPRRLQSNVPMDLETISLKCLQKDPKKRYASALELADDLKRFQNAEPILARPVGHAERAWRWCRKNPRLAMMSGGLVGVILLSIATLTWLYLMAENSRAQAEHAKKIAVQQKAIAEVQKIKAEHSKKIAVQQQAIAEAQKKQAEQQKTRAQQKEKEAKEQQKRAEQEAAKARKVAEFLVGMFEASDPLGLQGYTFSFQSGGQKLTARDILDRGASLVEQQLRDQPLVQASTMDTIGGVYRSLGMYREAERLLQKAYDIRLQKLGAEHEEVADSLYNLGWLYHNRGNYGKAKSYYVKALNIRKKLLGDEHPSVTDTLFNVAWLYGWMGELGESEKLFGEVVKRRKKFYGTDKHRQVALAKAGLAAIALERGQYMKAYPIAMQATNTLIELQGAKKLSEAIGFFQQGVFFGLGLRNYRQAEKLLRKAKDIVDAELGADHVYSAMVLYQLADAVEQQNRLDEAENLYRQCLEVGRKNKLLAHPRASIAVVKFALLLNRKKKYAQADAMFEEQLKAQRERFGADHPLVGETLVLFGEVLNDRGDYHKMETVLKDAVAFLRGGKEKYGYSSQETNDALRWLCRAQRKNGHFDKSLETALLWRSNVGANPNRLFNIGCEIARLLPDIKSSTQGKPEDRRRLEAAAEKEAFRTLGLAVKNGFKDGLRLASDSRLAVLAGHLELKKILKQVPTVDWNKVRVLRGQVTRSPDALIDGKYSAVHTVTLKQGTSVRIDLRSVDFDTYLKIEDASGKLVARDDDSGAGRNSRIRLRPSQSGDYRIIVTSFGGRSTGAYSLVLQFK